MHFQLLTQIQTGRDLLSHWIWHNFNGNHWKVHGGLILSLTDTLGSLAVASKGHFMTGVSTDIGTSFVRPAGRVGDTLYAKAILTGMGRQYQSLFVISISHFLRIRKTACIYPRWFHQSCWRTGCLWMYGSAPVSIRRFNLLLFLFP